MGAEPESQEKKSNGGGLVLGVVLVVMAVAWIIAVTKEGPTGEINHSFTLGEIRGDRLGMPYAEYAKRHSWGCGGDDKTLCVEPDTYAGASGYKTAFFAGGRLSQISYSFDASDREQVIAAVKEKYGDTRHTADSYSWDNGTQEISLEISGKHGQIIFKDKALSDLWSKEYEQKKAAQDAASKKDQ